MTWCLPHQLKGKLKRGTKPHKLAKNARPRIGLHMYSNDCHLPKLTAADIWTGLKWVQMTVIFCLNWLQLIFLAISDWASLHHLTVLLRINLLLSCCASVCQENTAACLQTFGENYSLWGFWLAVVPGRLAAWNPLLNWSTSRWVGYLQTGCWSGCWRWPSPERPGCPALTPAGHLHTVTRPPVYSDPPPALHPDSSPPVGDTQTSKGVTLSDVYLQHSTQTVHHLSVTHKPAKVLHSLMSTCSTPPRQFTTLGSAPPALQPESSPPWGLHLWHSIQRIQHSRTLLIIRTNCLLFTHTHARMHTQTHTHTHTEKRCSTQQPTPWGLLWEPC